MIFINDLINTENKITFFYTINKWTKILFGSNKSRFVELNKEDFFIYENG